MSKSLVRVYVELIEGMAEMNGIERMIFKNIGRVRDVEVRLPIFPIIRLATEMNRSSTATTNMKI